MTDAQETMYGGLICDNSAQVRRVSWYGAVPASTFTVQNIKVLLYDDDIVKAHTDAGTLEDYIGNTDNYSSIKQDTDANPSTSWNVPMVTGHKYKVSWGAAGLDFEDMYVKVMPIWWENDDYIEVVHNHTDVRVYINATQYDNNWAGTQINNDTYNGWTSTYEMGTNVHYESVDVQEFTYVVTGSDRTKLDLYLDGDRCFDENCLEDGQDDIISDTPELWSETATWTDRDYTYPLTGEDVVIDADAWIQFDLDADTDVEEFGTITVYGRLEFLDGADRYLRAHNIFIRGGELLIGSRPYTYIDDNGDEQSVDEVRF